MRLTMKDLYATVVAAAVVGAYAAYLGGTTTWLLDSTRGTTVVVFVIGAIGCGFGSAGDLYSGERSATTRTLTTITSALGVLAAVAAAAAVIGAYESALAVLVGTVVALWLISTARHAFVPTGPSLAERDRHERIEPTQTLRH